MGRGCALRIEARVQSLGDGGRGGGGEPHVKMKNVLLKPPLEKSPLHLKMCPPPTLSASHGMMHFTVQFSQRMKKDTMTEMELSIFIPSK